MANLFVNNVLMLSETAGTAAYEFTGNVAGYTSFASQMAAGDLTIYFARDSSEWEVGFGVRQTGPERLTRALIASSTGSLIAWPGSGSREVGGSVPAVFLNFLISTAVANGFLTKTAVGAIVSRTFGNGTFITWSNPSGLGGNPTLVDSGLPTNFLRRNATASLVAALEMATGFSLEVDYFTGSPSVAPWNGPGGESMFRWRRTAAQDYLAELRQSSAWRRMLTANASDLNDADRLQTYAASAFPRLAFSSGPQTITSGGLLTLPHGIGAKPKFVTARLTCVNANANYSPGDTIELGAGTAGPSFDHGHSIRTTTTNVVVRFGGDSFVYEVPGASTGISATLTNGDWTIEFFAFA